MYVAARECLTYCLKYQAFNASPAPRRSHDPVPVGPRYSFLLQTSLPSFFIGVGLHLCYFATTQCLLSSFLNPNSPSMPTPSDNQPTSIAEVISTRTCPPELDRDPAWRDSPDSAGSTSDTIDDVLSPGSAIAPSVLSRSDDGSALLATDPLKVESKIPVVDDDIAPGRSTSPAVSSDRTQSAVSPPTSSLLRYEFSNVRVRTDPLTLIAPQQLTGNIASAKPFLFLSSLRKQIRWNTTVRPSGV